ncbi:MAG: FAD-dependent monooxygenase [Reyranellales bacterium]
MVPILAPYDAIIVGARCAGASLALLLARRGRRVLALDRAHFPSDTMSTHFLWPRTTAALARWGLLDALAATGCPLIETVNMQAGSVAFRGRPEPVDGTAAMYCPRRTVLDKLLVDAGREADAEMREGALVRDVIREDGRVVGVRGDGIEERAALVVGAAGMTSGIAEAVGAAMSPSHPSLTCGFYAYWSGVPTDGVEFYVRAGRDILVFPTHDGLTCVWVGRASEQWPAYRADIEGQYLAGLDAAVLARVQRGRRETPFKGTHRLPNFYRDCAGAGWALVGDAAYHRDPLTGMGIGDAFLGAELLAEAIDRGLGSDLDAALKGYQETLREKTAAVFEYTLMSAALKDPEPQARLNRAIAADPDLTQRFMNVLGGSAPFRTLFNARTMGMALRQ